MEYDYAVIGGGVVGLAIVYGLLKRGKTVVCIDGSDGDYRASRGNFGLVWIQGKGLNAPHYAQWTQRSIRAYQRFIKQLSADSGVSISYQQTGGYEYFLDQDSMAKRVEAFENLKTKLAGDYPFEVYSPERIQAEEPMVGSKVKGATFHPEDGHLNPLQLLHALSTACHRMAFTHITNDRVVDTKKAQNFTLTTQSKQKIKAKKVVLCAGLGAKTLGPMLGFKGLVVPQRGQVLVTEKFPPILKRPSLRIRQVNEGAIQLGDSKELVGLNDRETVNVISSIAKHATEVMPFLKNARLIRTWGALRVMSPDGLPIYQKSTRYEGASLLTCHSGISLAPVHANDLIDWLEGMSNCNLEQFGEARFD